MMTLQTSQTRLFLLTSALAVFGLGACDKPKQIGDETQGESESESEGETKGDSEGETKGDTKGDSEGDTNDGECQAGDTKYDACGNKICTCEGEMWQCNFIGCEEPQPACKPGDEKKIDCNDCVCDDEGNWACDKKGCDPEPACKPGDKKMIECNACVCDEDGNWACDDQDCNDKQVCGDGIVQPPELCDDGNDIDDDKCPNDCGIGQNQCAEGDPKTIENAKIVGDTLVADLSYGGGCAEHFVEMCWDGVFAESEPVQVWVSLVHDGNNDPCDAILNEQHVIDLKPLKTSYQDAYKTQTGKITIHLDDWKNSLLYAF